MWWDENLEGKLAGLGWARAGLKQITQWRPWMAILKKKLKNAIAILGAWMIFRHLLEQKINQWILFPPQWRCFTNIIETVRPRVPSRALKTNWHVGPASPARKELEKLLVIAPVRTDFCYSELHATTNLGTCAFFLFPFQHLTIRPTAWVKAVVQQIERPHQPMVDAI